MCKSTFTSIRKSEVVFLFTPMASHISPSRAFINAVLPEPAGPDTTRSPGNKPAVSKLSLNVVNALIICHQKVNIERLSLTRSLTYIIIKHTFLLCVPKNMLSSGGWNSVRVHWVSRSASVGKRGAFVRNLLHMGLRSLK